MKEWSPNGGLRCGFLLIPWRSNSRDTLHIFHQCVQAGSSLPFSASDGWGLSSYSGTRNSSPLPAGKGVPGSQHAAAPHSLSYNLFHPLESFLQDRQGLNEQWLSVTDFRTVPLSFQTWGNGDRLLSHSFHPPFHLCTWAVSDRGLMATEETCSDNCSLERAKVSEPAQASSICPMSHRMTQSRRGQVTCIARQSGAKEHVLCPRVLDSFMLT